MKFNPNMYCFLCQSKDGYVLANNIAADLIVSYRNPAVVLGYMKDFHNLCKYFIEVVEIETKVEYTIGDKIPHNNQLWYVLEIAENSLDSSDENQYTVLIGR